MKRRCTFAFVTAALLAASAVLAGESRGVSVVRAPTGEALTGRNWLLLIAINTYKEWPPLRGPRKDAEALKEALLSRYAFDRENVVELYDESATMEGINRAFSDLRPKVRSADSLLIYYAGHGHTDNWGTGYWIPHDAGRNRMAQERWLTNAAVRARLRAMDCAHILLISDSCFSGDLLDEQRGAEPEITEEYFRRAYSMRSRQILTSGSSEPVSDTSLGGHSAFAFHLVDTLKRNTRAYLDPLQLYVHIRAGVKGQMPLLGNLKGAGHQEGGAYLLFLREATPKSGRLDLSDLTRRSEDRKLWDDRLERMRADLRKVRAFADGNPPAELAAEAWRRFLETHREDNPLSEEDEGMRLAAERALSRLRAGGRGPERTDGPAKAPGPALTIDLGGGVKLELVRIKPGWFRMGSGVIPDQKPAHEVVVTRGFYLGRYELTQAQYGSVTGRNPSEFEGPDRPVENVSWNDAVEFCRKLSERAGRRFRLPTEAEWEYAARAGSTGAYCFGDDEARLGGYAWCKESSHKQTHTVGQKKPNDWGLHDMHGNVYEWCADWYADDYYRISPRQDPRGPTSGDGRVLRGGSWNFQPWFARSASRLAISPLFAGNYVGFRVAAE